MKQAVQKSLLSLLFLCCARGWVCAAEAAHDEAHKGEEVKLDADAVKRIGISVAAVQRKALAASVVAATRLVLDADATAHVGALVPGRVVEIKARVGDFVKKDDVLLVVESSELGKAQSELLQRRTEADVAAAAVPSAKDAYDRAKSLFDDSNGIALAEVQKRDVEYRSAVGAAATAKAAYQAAENTLRLLGMSEQGVQRLIDSGEVTPRYEVRALIAGTILERGVTVGELVSPEKEKLLVIADLTLLWAMADVPEGRLADVGVGSRAEIQLAALPNVRRTGEVSMVSGEVDAVTRTARLRVVVQNADGKLRPGMFARALIQPRITEANTALVIPEEAVQTVEGRACVFVPVEGEDNTFAARPVTIGRPVGGYIPVIAGLGEHDSVVAAGSFILKAELGKSEASHEH